MNSGDNSKRSCALPAFQGCRSPFKGGASGLLPYVRILSRAVLISREKPGIGRALDRKSYPVSCSSPVVAHLAPDTAKGGVIV